MTKSTSPLQALLLFRSAPADFDVMITDLAMPDLPGLELAAAVHQIRPDISHIAQVGLLGFTSNSSRWPEFGKPFTGPSLGTDPGKRVQKLTIWREYF